MKKQESNTHLLPHYYTDLVEAGCDEAGRGCLAGSVYAAAVILPPDYDNALLNDSKKLSEKARRTLRDQIVRDAVAWAVGVVTPEEIDRAPQGGHRRRQSLHTIPRPALHNDSEGRR